MGQFNSVKDFRYGKIIYNTYDLFVCKSIHEYGEWCQGELDLLQQIIKPGMTVLDIGANIGTHTLPFAAMVGISGKVLAFEPQRHFFYMLAGSVALNSLRNVWCYYHAVSDTAGTIPVEQLDLESHKNFGALALEYYHGISNNFEEVPVIRIDDLELPSCHLIKIDVEGMEEKVLRGAVDTINRYRPILYTEDERPYNSESLIGFIESLEYNVYRHITPFFNPDNFQSNKNNIFGTYFSRNLLCIPREQNLSFPDLDKISK
ncbi:MAG: FkbM family methyltransferase [Clostridia bacterium]|nr:FkbM family methyltransferase [Clostridia bacterium]